MTITTTRQPAPDTEIRCPDCSICDEETDPGDDGGYYCEDCEAYFDGGGRFAGWFDADAAQCESRVVFVPLSRPHAPKRCLLADGHAGGHKSGPLEEWSDGLDPYPSPGWRSSWQSLTPDQYDELHAAHEAWKVANLHE